MKRILFLLWLSPLLLSCQQNLFPVDNLNTLTIAQRATYNQSVAYVMTGNHIEGTTANLWHYEEATNSDSAVFCGYVMSIPDRDFFSRNMLTIYRNTDSQKATIDFTSGETDLIFKKLMPGNYSIDIKPVALFETGFLFHDIELKAGDSLAFLIVIPAMTDNEVPNYAKERGEYAARLSFKKWHQRLFTNDYLYFDVNGKRVKRKVTANNYRIYRRDNGIEKPKKR